MWNRRLLLIAVPSLLVVALLAVGIGNAAAWGGPGGVMGGLWSGGTTGQGVAGGFGPGMMGGIFGRGATAQGTTAQGQTITMDQAIKNVQAYVDQTGNKDLAIDEVMEFQNNFYAIVKEKSTGIGAFELLVNKSTGAVTPEVGPNMMWNTKYGMHAGFMGAGYGVGYGSGYGSGYGPGGMMGGYGRGMMGGRYAIASPTGAMTVTSDQAAKIAQQWLDQNQPGSTIESPDQFYGYYTVHILKAGKITGMLSVNGYSGQVWYHTWHGAFIQMRELGG